MTVHGSNVAEPVEDSTLPKPPEDHHEEEDVIEEADLEEARKKREELEAEQKRQDAAKSLEKKRMAALQELMSTEKSYVHNLKLFEQYFTTPLKESMQSKTPILQLNDYQTLFGDLEVIVQVNKALLNTMEDVYRRMEIIKDNVPLDAKNKYTTLGACFLNLSHYLRSYNTYCGKYEGIFKMVEEKRVKDKRFKKFLEGIEFQPQVQCQSMISFMIQPVQRIPRYNMLLTEIIKCTDKGHQDYESLVKANDAVKQVANYVNERLRDAMNQERCIQISGTVQGLNFELVQANRKFVKEGKVGYITASRGIKDRILFLFTDLLMIVRRKSSEHTPVDEDEPEDETKSNSATTPGTDTSAPSTSTPVDTKKATFKLCSAISLLTTPLVSIQSVPDTFVIRNCFQIVTTRKVWTVTCKTATEKQEWMTAINKQLDIMKELPTLANQPMSTNIIHTGSLFYQLLPTHTPITSLIPNITVIQSPNANGNSPSSPHGGDSDDEKKSPGALAVKKADKKKRSSLVKFIEKQLKPKKKTNDQAAVYYVSDSEEEEPSKEDLPKWMKETLSRASEYRSFLKRLDEFSKLEEEYKTILKDLKDDDYECFVFNPLMEASSHAPSGSDFQDFAARFQSLGSANDHIGQDSEKGKKRKSLFSFK